MRIALVSPYDPFPGNVRSSGGHVGGVERVFAELARRLARRGHHTTVVCTSDEEGLPDEVDGVHMVRVPRRATILRAPIADLARHIPPADLIHVAATYPFTTPNVLRHAHRRGIPCILDFHFEPDPVTPWGRAAAWAYRRLGPRAYPLADAVLVRSHAYGERARSLNGVPRERWHELPNGFDPERFHPAGRGGLDGPLLFVGRLVPYKGLEHLLHAMQHVDAPLIIVGDGPLRGRLEALAVQLGIDVDFRGHVSEAALPDMYRDARFTVLPSVGQQESFGISLLESMACGTPVVASAIPGVQDVALLGGRTAPSGDPVALAKVLQAALHDDLPRGDQLAQSIEQIYSWDAITQRLINVYDHVLSSRAAEVRPRAHPRGDPVL